VTAPYKKPEHNYPLNEAFNKQVSMLQIQSEHAISFLKGHFQSLWDLCVLIWDERSHKKAVYWIVACIAIHSFATRCELERQSDDHDLADDPFVAAGLSPAFDKGESTPATAQAQASARLVRGKEKREWLKAVWMAENELYDDDDDTHL
jgi:hypothetical protein